MPDPTPQPEQPPAKKRWPLRNVTGTPEGHDLQIIGAGSMPKPPSPDEEKGEQEGAEK